MKRTFYNCNEKYVKVHRSREQKIFHMDVSLLVIVNKLSPEALSKDDETK